MVRYRINHLGISHTRHRLKSLKKKQKNKKLLHLLKDTPLCHIYSLGRLPPAQNILLHKPAFSGLHPCTFSIAYPYEYHHS